MTTKRLFFMIALTASLFGCASTPMRSMNEQPCNQGRCVIDVTVTDCKISVEPLDRHIERTNKNPVIDWNLGNSFPAFRWSNEGITFKQNPNDEFHHPGPSLFRKHFMWTDKNNTPGSYKYTVNVVRSTGEACAPYDPSVVND